MSEEEVQAMRRPGGSDLITTKEAAKTLNVNEALVKTYISQGKLKVVKVNGISMVKLADVTLLKGKL